MFDFGPGMGDSSFWQEPDFLLTDIISLMVNKAGMQLGVTLMIKGTVLTGTLISEREYLKGLSETFAAQAKKSVTGKPSKEEMKAIREAFDFTSLTEDDYEDEDGYDQDEVEKPIKADDIDIDDVDDEEMDDFDPDGPNMNIIRHLHLKDPSILSPQPSITFTHGDFSVIRIRLTAVDGWMLGRSTVFNGDEPRSMLH